MDNEKTLPITDNIMLLLRPLGGLQKDKFYLFFCEALQNAAFARH